MGISASEAMTEPTRQSWPLPGVHDDRRYRDAMLVGSLSVVARSADIVGEGLEAGVAEKSKAADMLQVLRSRAEASLEDHEAWTQRHRAAYLMSESRLRIEQGKELLGAIDEMLSVLHSDVDKAKVHHAREEIRRLADALERASTVPS